MLSCVIWDQKCELRMFPDFVLLNKMCLNWPSCEDWLWRLTAAKWQNGRSMNRKECQHKTGKDRPETLTWSLLRSRKINDEVWRTRHNSLDILQQEGPYLTHDGIKQETHHNQKECRHGQMQAACPALTRCQIVCRGSGCARRSHSAAYTLFWSKTQCLLSLHIAYREKASS